MPKFKLQVDYPITLGNPRNLQAMSVEPGQIVEVPGAVVTSRAPGLPPLPDDAYVVDDNGVEKAWPHTLWSLVEDKPAAPVPAPVKEN